jgi:hypothetical protein
MAAGLTFLLFFPGVLRLGAPTYLAATGLTQEPFAARWLLLTAAFFAASAVLYALRLGRATIHASAESPPDETARQTTDPGQG